MPKFTFTDDQILVLSMAIKKMAVLWDVSMSDARLSEYLETLVEDNTRMPFDTIMRSIRLARVQDTRFPMPADILMREMKPGS